ncbi:MAG: hypothetical protein AAF571_01095 [Verrucomicrobiota bacterium]
MSFPKNLVSYEIALERAFRMLLGSELDAHSMPDAEAVGEAFFKQLEPGDFAQQWLADEKYRFSDESPSPDTEENQFDSGVQEEELF